MTAKATALLGRAARLGLAILVQAAACLGPGAAWAAPEMPPFSDNGDSIAVVTGNSRYKQTVPVDDANNDAEAMRSYLVQRLGDGNASVFVLKDATLDGFDRAFGTGRNPQSGRLWLVISRVATR
ncbi:hypothetical protein [Methylobacterium tarhaniae]|uniref:hypothetical protein n=1 Tax=Methylobacterium tarhaniae TaxID=1187852 RepID=UPI003CFEF9B3